MVGGSTVGCGMALSDKILRRVQQTIRKTPFHHLVRPTIIHFPEREPKINNDVAKLVYAHDGHIVHKWDHYLEIYDRHFAKFRGTNFKFLEIGVRYGGSLEVWRKYFGAQATIFGIDVDERCLATNCPPSINIRIGSQANPDFLRSVVKEMGGVDIVIDDGSHVVSHQRTSFETLFPLVSQNGVYLIEDLHTNYWRGEYEGGWKRRSTFIEQMKDLVDDIHGYWHTNQQRYKDAHKQISAISFYDSVIAIERKAMPTPYSREIGRKSF
jgi:hypothetical protein